jgi:hypothetical protein
MKKIVLASLIAAAASQGCTVVEEGHISATWRLRNAVPATVTGCPVGFDTAGLYSQQVDPVSLAAIGSPIVDLFNCSANAGVSAPLVAGSYIAYVQIETHDGSTVWAKSPQAFVDITNVDKTISVDLINDGGYFFLSWSLFGQTTNQPLTCAQAGASGGVETIATVTGSSTAYNDMFNCTDHFNYTAAVPAANYTISVDAINSANQAIGTAPTITNKTMNTNNDIVDLGHIMIPITGM